MSTLLLWHIRSISASLDRRCRCGYHADMNTLRSKLHIRILVGLGMPFCAVLLCLYVLRCGIHIPCFFHELTGLYCPGCGSGRAVTALLHGRPAEMFSYNCMLVFLGVPCVCVLVHEYLRIVFPSLHLKPVFIPHRAEVFLAAVMIGYWILRNIPAFSFLAPG